MEKFIEVPPIYMGRPTLAFILMEVITSATEDFLREIIDRVENTKIINFVDEYIDKSEIRIIWDLLQLKWPPIHTHP